MVVDNRPRVRPNTINAEVLGIVQDASPQSLRVETIASRLHRKDSHYTLQQAKDGCNRLAAIGWLVRIGRGIFKATEGRNNAP